MRGMRAAGRDLQYAGTGPERSKASQQGRSRNLHAARNDQHAPPLLLVSLFMLRQWMSQQEFARDFNGAHRAATLASGAEVTGAPSCSSGATKLYLVSTSE